jgi:hypothetical protein
MYSLHSQLVCVLDIVKVNLFKFNQIFRNKYQHLQRKIYSIRIAIKHTLILYLFDIIEVDFFPIFLVKYNKI